LSYLKSRIVFILIIALILCGYMFTHFNKKLGLENKNTVLSTAKKTDDNERPEISNTKSKSVQSGYLETKLVKASGEAVEKKIQIVLDSTELFQNERKVENSEKSLFNKTYKKVYDLEIGEGEELEMNLVFSKPLKDVSSVLLVGKEGVLSPIEFNIDDGRVSKGFKAGQEIFKNDWVKLSTETGELKEIGFRLKGQKELNLIEVYVQKLN